jgi:uncharacterized membrane protein (UPF0127 family)
VRILGLLLLIFLIVGCGGETGDSSSRSANTTPDSNLHTLTIESSNGDKVEVWVEIADNDAERARGLMGRTALAEDRGMLFVFDEEQTLSFWMKNTLIPLSIAFMDSEGRIVDIQDMKPLDDDPPHYVSAKPARYALEVNQGFFEERGVKVGDRADLPE